MSHRRQKGMAVIGALLVVAATSVATAAIMERQSLLADTLFGERDRVQAKWLLRGGLDWARVILSLDARNNAVTLKNALWAQPIAGLEIETSGGQKRAYFSGLIEDEQGKYNLSRLATAGELNAGELARFQTLLSHLGLPESLALAITQRVAGSQVRPGQPATALGLRTVEDLAAVQGVTPSTLAMLSEYLTLLPADVPLNINTAGAEVLSASIPGLDLASARSMVQERERGMWFTSRGDFLNRLERPELARRSRLDVRSDWFKVSGEVRLNQAASSMTALLHRQGSAPPTLLWIRG